MLPLIARMLLVMLATPLAIGLKPIVDPSAYGCAHGVSFLYILLLLNIGNDDRRDHHAYANRYFLN